MMNTASGYRDLKPGIPVFTLDDVRLGTVGEVSGRSFEIIAEDERFWLTTDMIRSATPEGVTVIFRSINLSDYRQRGPLAG
jgi:hypothetical protein